MGMKAGYQQARLGFGRMVIAERGVEVSGGKLKAKGFNLEEKGIDGFRKGGPLVWIQEILLETGDRKVNRVIIELNDGAEIPPVTETGTAQDGRDRARAIVVGEQGMKMILGEPRDGTMMREAAPLRERGGGHTHHSIGWAGMITIEGTSKDLGRRETTIGEETECRLVSIPPCMFCLDVLFLDVGSVVYVIVKQSVVNYPDNLSSISKSMLHP